MTERKNQAELRKQCFERDGGVCAKCGIDTFQLFNDYYPTLKGLTLHLVAHDGFTCLLLIDQAEERFKAECQQMRAQMHHRAQLKARHPWIAKLHSADDCWQADHCVPLAENGTNDIGNIRTLCLQCHAEVTKDLKKRLARRPVKNGKRL